MSDGTVRPVGDDFDKRMDRIRQEVEQLVFDFMTEPGTKKVPNNQRLDERPRTKA